MKRIILLLLLALGMFNCEKEAAPRLDVRDNLSFDGTMATRTSGDLGTVTLRISNGSYECSTSLPYGHGAGRLAVGETTLNFIDTLFVAIPAIYGPTYVLSGEHTYDFDGKNLTIHKADMLHYKLRLKK